MAKTDKAAFVSHRLTAILEAGNQIEKKLEHYSLDSGEKPDIVPELFQMLNAADDLVELASPGKTVGEFHGLPKSATTAEFSRVLFTHSENPDWDYAAWYGEKVSQLKRFVKFLIGYWEMDYRQLTLPSSSPETPQEYINEGIRSSLEAISGYAQVVFDEILNGRLQIQEIRAEE
jgi:hypothetical protein